MEYTAHQKKIIKEMKERKPTLVERGDKVARHYFEQLLGIGDYLEKDMDGPINYQEQ